MIISFATSSYRHSALPISAQRTVNLYAEREPPDAKTQVAVLGSPGLMEFTSIGRGPIRGFNNLAGVLHVVSGGILYSVSSTGVGTALGGTISGSNVLSMDNNGTQLCIVNGTVGYIYTTAGGLQLITDADFFPANTVTFFDQRFVFDKKNSNQFFASDTLDGTAYTGTAIATAEARPDYVIAVRLNGQVLLVFGEKTIEAWQDIGAPNFPYERIPGALIERGLLAPYAFCSADNTTFFLGENRVLYRLAGLSPQRVSNHAIETEWQDYTKVSDAFLFSFHFNGHEFVYVTFPSRPATWVFDISSGMPHERESWDVSGHNLGRWRGNCTINIYDKTLIGDAFTGKIGYLSNTTYTEYGNTMQGSATGVHVHSDRKRVFVPRLELDVETGVGLNTGQGSDPQIMLDISKDGGRTFGSRQLWKSMGALGEYRKRLKWTRLGQARDWVFRVTIADPVKRTIIAANADVIEGI